MTTLYKTLNRSRPDGILLPLTLDINEVVEAYATHLNGMTPVLFQEYQIPGVIRRAGLKRWRGVKETKTDRRPKTPVSDFIDTF